VPAKVGPEKIAGAASCRTVPEQHLPGHSLPCLHQHRGGQNKSPGFERNQACPNPVAHGSPTHEWFLVVSKPGRVEIGQIAGRYTCRGASRKGSFLRLGTRERGMSYVPPSSLAPFEDRAGKPLPGGSQAGALLQPFFPLLPRLPPFPPLAVLSCSCRRCKSKNCPAGWTGGSRHTATWLHP